MSSNSEISSEAAPRRRRRLSRRRDWGGLFARMLCTVFALMGLLPLLIGAVVRIGGVQRWAADYTEDILRKELGLSASYELHVRPWPLELGLEHVVIDATDGGSPVLQARRVVARPRMFYLLAGKPDLGQVNIEEPRVRVVLKDGELANLKLDLPESSGGDGPDEPPLSAVSITSGNFDVAIDTLRVRATDVDVDVSLDGEAAEVALRAGSTLVDRRHADPAHPGEEMLDEDVVCRLDVRARLSPQQLLVRRLSLLAAADLDGDGGTRPSCELSEEDWRMVSVEGSSLEAWLHDGQLATLDGRISARVPAAIANRFIDLAPVTGWVAVDIDRLHFDTSRKLPQLSGRLRGDALGIDSKFVAHKVEGRVDLRDNTIAVRDLKARWAAGDVSVEQATVRPFDKGIPLDVRNVHVEGVTLPDLMDELAGHPSAHVGWVLAKTHFDSFQGTLDPVDLSGALVSETRDFGIYDRPTTDKLKRPFMELAGADLTGVLAVTPDAIQLRGFTAVTPRSRVHASVSLGFNEELGITVREGSAIDLRDISPLVEIPIEGRARLSALGTGTFGDPQVQGKLQVDGFVFAGFPIGDVQRADVRFEPLHFELTNAAVTHGRSAVDVPRFFVDFDDGDAAVLLKAQLDTRRGGLHLKDFFSMIRRDEDPRFASLNAVGRGEAEVHYVLGGHRDRCDTGKLLVRSQMSLSQVNLYDEHYDGGEVDFRYLWDDFDAGDRGMVVDVYSAVLNKGGGNIAASATVRHGGKLRADVVGSGVPLTSLDVIKDQFAGSDEEAIVPDATGSFVAAVGGTLSRLEGTVDVHLSPMRLGPDVLPPSRLRVDIVPTAPPARVIGKTRCGYGITPDFNLAEYQRDRSEGVYRVSGEMFAGQVRFDGFEVTQQRSKRAKGRIELDNLNIGKIANLASGVAFAAKRPRGTVSASIDLQQLEVDRPSRASADVTLLKLDVARGDQRLIMGAVAQPLTVGDDKLTIPELPVTLVLSEGLRTKVALGGQVSRLSSPSPSLDMKLRIEPVQLSELGIEIPRVERAAGLLAGNVTVKGTTSLPQLAGKITLQKGTLKVAGAPLTLDDIDVELLVRDGEIQLKRVNARVGNTGMVSVSGRVPLRGLDIAGVDATLIAKDVQLPLADGVKLTANAALNTTHRIALGKEQKSSLPLVTGTVSLTQFNYSRPMSFSLDLEQLAGRAPTSVKTYNPEDDMLRFDVRVVSPRPLRVSNNLVDMRVDVAGDGLRVLGTNQRFGARGELKIQNGSQLFLQKHDFRIGEGTIVFDDPERIAPRLDVRATTEYRRYASAADADTSGADVGGASAGGRWRIGMHAHGDTDAPKITFSSDPPLSQEDIVLLLQLGMTRAELDRGLASTLAQTVGLEALSAVTGFDQALRKTLPLFDEVRVLSQYSSRTGRPEPTLLVGKRIGDQLRATVTTGLSQNQEIRSNIEWKLSRGVSVQASYDNVNDISSSLFGNLGADLRWRLEFE